MRFSSVFSDAIHRFFCVMYNKHPTLFCSSGVARADLRRAIQHVCYQKRHQHLLPHHCGFPGDQARGGFMLLRGEEVIMLICAAKLRRLVAKARAAGRVPPEAAPRTAFFSRAARG